MDIKITYKDKRDPWKKSEIKLDPEDTWSMDSTLAEVIVPMLKQLRDTCAGYPIDLMHDGNIPKDYDNTCEDYDDNKGPERWTNILNKMIYSFTEATDGYEKPFNEKLSREAHNKYFKDIQEGLDLFGKYYMNLWD